MARLIDSNGKPHYGIIETPVEDINYMDFSLESPMGSKVSGLMKKLIFHQFAFFGLTGPDYVIGMAVVDLKYIANAFFYVYDRKNNKIIETSNITLPVGNSIFIKTTPENICCGFASKKISISIDNGRLSAKTKDVSLDLEFDSSVTSPLRICSKAGYKRWVYTQKTTPIKLSGELLLDGQKISLASPQYMGLSDWTAGYMRRETFWNWAATASTLADGRSFGMNLSCGVNETSFTENAFWIDGKMTKVNTVQFEFNPENFYDPWRIISADGKVNLMFESENHRAEKVNALVIATRFTQMIGTIKGTVKTDDNKVVKIDGCPGWAEDHYAKW